MRLTQWTDFTLRVLMYCAACEGREQPVTISEVADSYGVSRSHLTKIVQELSAMGLLETTRGRGGGMRLLKPARQINIGAVVRATETDFTVVECFDPDNNQCRLSSHCRLQSVLGQAIKAFFAVLDQLTLEDLMVLPASASLAATGDGYVPMVPGLPRSLVPPPKIPDMPQLPERPQHSG